jgi:hypothetical protein
LGSRRSSARSARVVSSSLFLGLSPFVGPIETLGFSAECGEERGSGGSGLYFLALQLFFCSVPASAGCLECLSGTLFLEKYNPISSFYVSGIYVMLEAVSAIVGLDLQVDHFWWGGSRNGSLDGLEVRVILRDVCAG